MKGENVNLTDPNNSDNEDTDEDCDKIASSTQALLPKLNHKEELLENGANDPTADKYVQKVHGNHYHESDLPTSTSSQALGLPNSEVVINDGISTTRKYAAVGVLFLINLLNYMDRYTIAGVLLNIQRYFHVNNASAGLLQTIFFVSYMLFAPPFGYLGDRYNRKIVMLVGMIIWSGCTLFSSFITDKSHFYVFLLFRGLVGVGEASYSTIAPTIIADLFVKEKRTRMLSVFYFAIPVGSGLGYIVGSAAAKAFGSWHWALRITPGLGVLTMILMLLILPNPKRGGAETSEDVIKRKGLDKNRTSYKEDLKYVFTNPSFMWTTFAVTFMAFVVGSLTLWGPPFVAYSQIVIGALRPCTDDSCEYANISLVFGVVTCVAGFAGVWIGAESAKKWKEKGNKDADAHVCAIGQLVAAPLLLLGLHVATVSLPVAWAIIFLADLNLCLTWALVGDITLYVTLPIRRSTAQAVQILIMHLFGDAGSPLLLGVISDSLTSQMPDSYYAKYIGLLRAMYITLFVAVLSGGCFLMTSLHLRIDKKKVDDYLANSGDTSSLDESSSTVTEQIEDPLTSRQPFSFNVDQSKIDKRCELRQRDNRAEPVNPPPFKSDVPQTFINPPAEAQNPHDEVANSSDSGISRNNSGEFSDTANLLRHIDVGQSDA